MKKGSLEWRSFAGEGAVVVECSSEFCGFRRWGFLMSLLVELVRVWRLNGRFRLLLLRRSLVDCSPEFAGALSSFVGLGFRFRRKWRRGEVWWSPVGAAARKNKQKSEKGERGRGLVRWSEKQGATMLFWWIFRWFLVGVLDWIWWRRKKNGVGFWLHYGEVSPEK
ncbi:hypothetical protein R3W88_019934 [Solanum pinnatisectum]|uniref:Transmembrane protein n=1 Tax=Solanum pinnatisectum TaxID=50273 RepID=A0AAV9KPP2_9SOLN|nr:hypothetical protein R3W88_019934 [Solanum pinnatisectum]